MESTSCCQAFELFFEAWKGERMCCDVVGVENWDVWVWGIWDGCDGRRVYSCIIPETDVPVWLVGLIFWIRWLLCRGKLWGIWVGETDWEVCLAWKFAEIKVFDFWSVFLFLAVVTPSVEGGSRSMIPLPAVVLVQTLILLSILQLLHRLSFNRFWWIRQLQCQRTILVLPFHSRGGGLF